jgi:hypothetical protein
MSRATREVAGLAMVVGICGACGLPYGPYASPPPRPAPLVTVTAPEIAPEIAPVEARLLPPFDGLLVIDANQPVYVAVFDVRPFMAIQLLFPGPNDEGLVDAGVHGVAPFYLTDAREERQVLYAPAAGGGEEYLYLIASRVPLDLSAFAAHPIARVDSLMRTVVNPLYGEDWDSDVYIVSLAPTVPTRAHRTIACDDGTVAFMPVSYPFSICPRYDRVVSPEGRGLVRTANSVQAALAPGYTPAMRTQIHKPLTIGPWHPVPVTGAFSARSTADGARTTPARAEARTYEARTSETWTSETRTSTVSSQGAISGGGSAGGGVSHGGKP